MRRSAASLILAVGSVIGLASGQSFVDNAIHVKQFPGVTVGQKLTVAQQTCAPNVAMSCVLILDPSLAVYPQGTFPTLCTQCTLLDMRFGWPPANNNFVSLANWVNFQSLSAAGLSDTISNRFSNFGAQAGLGAVRNRLFLWVDPQTPVNALDGNSNPVPTPYQMNSSERIVDARGTNCMGIHGLFEYNDNGFCLEASDDAQDYNGSVTANYNAASGAFKDSVHVGFNSLRGGVYSFLSGTGGKSNRMSLFVTGEYSTRAQNWLTRMDGGFYTNGESFGAGVVMNHYGGYEGPGQVHHAAFWGQINQGGVNDGEGGAFRSTNAVISSNVISYTPLMNEFTLGEARIVRDISRPYRAGTISGVSCAGSNPSVCTITGSGTTWTSISGFVGTHSTWNTVASGGPLQSTNMTFCFDPAASNGVDNAQTNGTGYDWCVPIYQGLTDTTLSVILYSLGAGQNTGWNGGAGTTGGYAIFPAAYPSSVDKANHNFTTLDASGITAGDSLDQVLAYNADVDGLYVSQTRQIGFSGRGIGLWTQNLSPSGAPQINEGVGVDGDYLYQICEGCQGVPSNKSPKYNETWMHTSSGRFYDQVASTTGHQNGYYYKNSANTLIELFGYNRTTATDTSGMTLMNGLAFVTETGVGQFNGLALTSGNNWAGTITVTSSNSATVTFSPAFTHNPAACVVSPAQGSAPASGTTWYVNFGPTSLQIELSASVSSQVFSYVCIANLR